MKQELVNEFKEMIGNGMECVYLDPESLRLTVLNLKLS